jgi:hypothetical protein
MTKRRSRGDGGLHWDDKRQRWIATAHLGHDGRGKRIVKRASGKTNVRLNPAGRAKHPAQRQRSRVGVRLLGG